MGKKTFPVAEVRPKGQMEEQAKEILEKAQEMGIEHSFMFVTTFERYQEHITHLEELQKAIEDEGMIVTKEYVKGRANIYVNPAVSAYNQTANAADKTAQLLMKYIVVSPSGNEPGDEFDSF